MSVPVDEIFGKPIEIKILIQEPGRSSTSSTAKPNRGHFPAFSGETPSFEGSPSGASRLGPARVQTAGYRRGCLSSLSRRAGDGSGKTGLPACLPGFWAFTPVTGADRVLRLGLGGRDGMFDFLRQAGMPVVPPRGRFPTGGERNLPIATRRPERRGRNHSGRGRRVIGSRRGTRMSSPNRSKLASG